MRATVYCFNCIHAREEDVTGRPTVRCPNCGKLIRTQLADRKPAPSGPLRRRDIRR